MSGKAILRGLLSPVAAVTGILGGAPKAPKPLPVATPNPGADAVRAADALRGRRGVLDNIYAGNAEAVTPGARALFGQG